MIARGRQSRREAEEFLEVVLHRRDVGVLHRIARLAGLSLRPAGLFPAHQLLDFAHR